MPDKRNDHPSFVKLARTMRRWGNPRLVEHAFSGSPDGQMAAQMVLRERGIRTHDHLGEPLGRAAVEANVQTVKDVLSRDRRTR